MRNRERILYIFKLFYQLILDTKDIYLNYLVVEIYNVEHKTNSKLHNKLYFQGCILNLYSTFQKYLCKLFRTQLKQTPLLYFANENILFSKLESTKFNKTKIIDELVEDKINNFTRGISDIKTLCSNLGIVNEGSFNELKLEYEEFCFRRNIYAHGIDYITKEYKEVNDKIEKKWLHDNDLVENEEYLKHSIDLICKMFFQIYYELNIANKKNISVETIAILENILYKQFYMKESWEVPKYIYKKLKNMKTSIRKHNVLIYKQLFYVNYLYCLKKTGQNIESLVEKMVLQKEKDKFEIARQALLDNNEKIYKLYKKLKNKKIKETLKINIKDLKEWPIFEGFRKTQYYKDILSNQ